MKIVLVSDLHLLAKNSVGRIDDLTETQFVKFRFILNWAKQEKAIVLQAGDFFDRPRSWYLLSRVISILKEYNVPVYGIYGGKNHDTYLHSYEVRKATNLGVLEDSGLVKILGSEPEVFKRVHIYGCSYGHKIPKVKFKKAFNILVIHAEIAIKPLYFQQKYIDAEGFLKEQKDFNLILCGDIHQNFIFRNNFGRAILNTGPMLRKEANQYNLKHIPFFYCANINTDFDVERIEIPHKPANEVLSRRHIKEDRADVLDDFIEDIQFGKFSGIDALELLGDVIKKVKNRNVKSVLGGLIKHETRDTG